MKRREFVSMAGLAGAAALARPGLAAEPPTLARAAGATMVVGCQRAPTDARRLQHFKRHGVDHICGYPGNEDDPASWSVESLTQLRELCESHGVSLDMVQFPTLSSASIDRLSRQHAANPQRSVDAAARPSCSARIPSGSRRSTPSAPSSATARRWASPPPSTT